MILYHGTSTIHSQSLNIMEKGTWLTSKRWHAFKLAERTQNRDGGDPIIICVEIPEELIDRVVGRDVPNYRIKKSYKPVRISELFLREELTACIKKEKRGKQ